MSAPSFQAAGAVVRGTAAITPQYPAGLQINDVALLVVESANEAVTLSDPQGFVAVTNSPQGTGTAGTSGATRLSVFWNRLSTLTPTPPTVADSGDHQVASIAVFRGCITTGNPWDVTAGGVQASAQTAFSIPTVTTTVADALVVMLLSNNGDAATNEMTVAPVNANLTTVTERIDTQPIPVAQQTAMLRVGPYGQMMDLVGVGPGGDFSNPYYRFVGINPFQDLANLQAQLDAADSLDVVLFVMLANAPSLYGVNTANGFVLGCTDPTNIGTWDTAGTKSYCGQLRALAARPEWPQLQAMLLAGKAVVMAGDEPYHAKWNNSGGTPTWTPTKVNQACRACKTIVGGPVLVFMRADLDKLATGNGGEWNHLALPPGNTYDALDYGTMQYEGPQAKAGKTFAQALSDARTSAATINVGVFPTLNLWAGGLQSTVDGVTRSWDYLNSGASSGVIAGAVQNSGSPYALGQQIPASVYDATPTASTLVSSPNWIRKAMDEVFNDADIPFFGYWTHSTPGLNLDPWATALEARSDFVAALDYAVNKGLTRPSANALRTPKA